MCQGAAALTRAPRVVRAVFDRDWRMEAGAPASARVAFAPGFTGAGRSVPPVGRQRGYDVSHYGLTLVYDPPSNHLSKHLDGRAVIHRDRHPGSAAL